MYRDQDWQCSTINRVLWTCYAETKSESGICQVQSVIEPWVGNSSSVTLIPFRLQKHGKGVDWCSNNEPRSFVKIWRSHLRCSSVRTPYSKEISNLSYFQPPNLNTIFRCWNTIHTKTPFHARATKCCSNTSTCFLQHDQGHHIH